MIEISEVLYQWQQGRNKSKIAESLGITRPTVRNYLKLAVAAGLSLQNSPGDVAAIIFGTALTTTCISSF